MEFFRQAQEGIISVPSEICVNFSKITLLKCKYKMSRDSGHTNRYNMIVNTESSERPQ